MRDVEGRMPRTLSVRTPGTRGSGEGNNEKIKDVDAAEDVAVATVDHVMSILVRFVFQNHPSKIV